MTEGFDVDRHREQLASIFEAHGVVLAYLFGSQAEKKAGALSDVDVAVLLEETMERQQWFRIQLDLIGELVGLFHRNDVDVVILNEATPLLAHEVVHHGRVIYEDEASRPAVDFAVRAITRYADTAPLRRLKQRYLEEWLQERRRARGVEPMASHQW
jgi:predicted nucleotidyltransferase